MSFDLDITIGGMCLLVPDPVNQKLHVLLPEIPATCRHDARLLFLKKYVNENGGDKEKEEVTLNGRTLDNFADLRCSNPLDLNIYPQVFDFATASPPRTVDRGLLTGALKPNVRFRMTLSGGDAVRLAPGGFWKFDGGAPRRVATSIKWRLADIEANALTLDVGDGAPKTLRPWNEGTGDKIRLFLLHLPEKEILDSIPADLPGPSHPAPDPGEEAHHFPFYYDLLTPRAGEQKLTFWSDGGEAPNEENRGSELTCTIARAPAGA